MVDALKPLPFVFQLNRELRLEWNIAKRKLDA